jgi:hypothetical protein
LSPSKRTSENSVSVEPGSTDEIPDGRADQVEVHPLGERAHPNFVAL